MGFSLLVAAGIVRWFHVGRQVVVALHMLLKYSNTCNCLENLKVSIILGLILLAVVIYAGLSEPLE